MRVGAANPVMVVIARESRGMNQRQLVEATGLAQSKLSKFENGLVPLSDEELARIADATGFRSEFFCRQDRIVGLGSSLLFNRKQKTTPISEQRQVQARVNIVRIQIERLLASAEMDTCGQIQRLDIDESDGDPRAVARRVRAALHLPLGPVQNLTRAVESVGGIVVLCNFGTTKIDAAHLWLPGSPPMFFMNADRPGDRHRFNLAHELGHAVMHEFPSGDIEKQANEFAAELLMPTEEIRHELVGLTIEKAARLKQRWKVSMAALIYNAHHLGRISDDRRRLLYSMLRSSMMPGFVEPISVAMEQPVLFGQLLRLHRVALGYGNENFRELFMMDNPDFIVFPDEEGPSLHTLKIDPPPIKFTDYRPAMGG